MRLWIGLLGVSLLIGTITDRPIRHAPVIIGGYRVLAADFHVHTFPLSGSPFTPWDAAIDADRQRLDVLAISGQNEVWSGAVGRWWSRTFGGPILLQSQEIHGPRFHMIAAGVHRTISWRLTASQAIDEIHRQGGVAIAAHPTASSWPAYAEDGAIGKLDGVEVFQPIAFAGEHYARELREFYQRSGAAAIGSSDYHGMGPLGICRTYLFVKEVSEAGVLEAIRARRTAVIDGERRFGERRFADTPHRDEVPRPNPASAILGIAGLLGLVLTVRRTMKLDGNRYSHRIP